MKFYRFAWKVAIVWLILSFPITYWDWQDRWHTTILTGHYAFKLWLYWAQFATLPMLLAIFMGKWRNLGFVWLSGKVVFCVGLFAMIWAGQIEPNLLRVRSTSIQVVPSSKSLSSESIKIALISDIHWGLFGRDWQLQRLVDRLNALEIDAVFVAGDWTYEPKLDLLTGFAPFKQLRIPVFAVLGNHDVEKPGPKLATQLRDALAANGVQFVEGRSIAWRGWQVIGLDDLWGGKPPHAQVANLFKQAAPNRLVLTHQPDTFALLPANAMQLGLAGHSHGGQVLLPYATDWQLRTAMKQGWYNGLYRTPHGDIFVTPGVGMIGLPWRFLVPPRIDVITISVQR
jgi:predicted MPP superfamily phosphohydrolase